MQIEDLKRWHWIAAGILVGLAFAYVWAGVEPSRGRRGSAEDLFRHARMKDPATGRPIVHSIVVLPLEQGANGPVNIVTYKKWMRDAKKQTTVSADFWFVAEVPFVPPGQRGVNVDPNFTVTSHLLELQKQNPELSFRSGWWTTTPATYAIWTLGSVVVIGLLWPTLLNVVIGAGYGRQRPSRSESRRDEYDLSRFSGGPEPAAPAKAAVSAQDQQRLHDMTRRLESELGGLGQVDADARPATPEAAPAIRKLDGGPLELSALESRQESDDEIEVKGEYYPVLIHHKKSHTDPSSDRTP